MSKLAQGIIFLVLLFPVSSFGNSQEISGMFSSFEISENSGDIVGMEIHIVPNPKGYSAVIQASEGAPGYPLVVMLETKGQEIRLTIPEGSNCGLAPGKFIGIVNKSGISLQGPKESMRYELPRKSSFWK